MNSEKIYDTLYIKRVEKIIGRGLTTEELEQLYVDNEFDIFIKGRHFTIEVPTVSLPFSLMSTKDMEMLYSLPKKEIVRKSVEGQGGTPHSKYNYFETTRLQYSRPTENQQYETSERYVEFLNILEHAVRTAC